MSSLPRRTGLLALLLTTACATSPAPKQAPFPLAELEQRPVAGVLLFHPKPPTQDIEAEAKALLARDFKGLQRAASREPTEPTAPASVYVERLPPEGISRISEREVKMFGRGFDAAQAQQLMGAEQATLLLFWMPRATHFESLKEATRFSHAMAERLGAFLWDAETRQYFTPASWKQQRLDGWKEKVPYLPDHITYHLYPTGKGLRAISLGMIKFGLPDLVVEQVPRSLNRDMGHLLNVSAQLLAEGGVALDATGTFPLSLERLAEPRAREELLAQVGPDAKRKTQLRAVQAKRDEGDPDNTLLELSFPGSEAALEERQAARLGELLGTMQEKLSQARNGDAELAGVAQKARRRLEELRPLVTKGLPPAATLSVKAGFPTDDGSREWMWFELVDWQGSTLRGTLMNTPRAVRGLKLGSPVEVRLDQVGDYLYRPGDGTEEGNESGRILTRRQGG